MASPRFPALTLSDSAAARVGRGHCWVFSNEVASVEGAPVSGAEVALFTPKKEFLGSALYNKNSLISARVFSRRTELLDEALLRTRLEQAIARRASLLAHRDAVRLVFSESDLLPGLIVDQYGSALSIQLLTVAMEQRRESILAALLDLLPQVQAIVERNDVPAREHEGLPLQKGLLWGTIPEGLLVTMHGLTYSVDPLEGQKTGLYLDQVENWRVLDPIMPGKKVLDLFSNVGGFGLCAARAGAASVKCVDSSALALSQVMFNASRNGLSHVKAKESDAFLYTRSMPDMFDVVICDPPPFARSRKQLDSALRGYREINRQCLGLLNPGGYLFTFSCSAAVGDTDFDKMLVNAGRDAGRTLRVLPGGGQPADHAPLLAMGETQYLKARLVQALD
jgi:23S rRNA (cytosine1962-C5)-methyltransferase